jgi:hypothetical protein
MQKSDQIKEAEDFPNGDDHSQAGPHVEKKAIRDLVDRILTCDDDDAAKAFVTLIHLIAYNDDRLDRDSLALYASDAAYQKTMAYHDVAGKFFDEAMAEFRSRVA